MDNKSIWNEKQNKPSLIADDFVIFDIPRNETYEILLRRGVFKWFAVRRDIIKVKNVWKARITETIEEIRAAKRNRDRDKLMYLRGYLKAHEECRAAIREMCHSERWRAPDFDRGAQKYLRDCEIEGS